MSPSCILFLPAPLLPAILLAAEQASNYENHQGHQ
jgi:hypothetical protein